MSALVVEVRAVENHDPSRPNGMRVGPYVALGQRWVPTWTQALLEPAAIAALKADPWLQVRELDVREQASRRMQLAIALEGEASAAEANAAMLRERATATMAEAKEAIDALADAPPAAPAPEAPTPYSDALLSAMPDKVREAVREAVLAEKNAIETTASQLPVPGRQPIQASVDRLERHGAAAKPGGTMANAIASASGKRAKS